MIPDVNHDIIATLERYYRDDTTILSRRYHDVIVAGLSKVLYVYCMNIDHTDGAVRLSKLPCLTNHYGH